MVKKTASHPSKWGSVFMRIQIDRCCHWCHYNDHYYYHYGPLLEAYYGPMLKSTFSEASKLPTGRDIGLSWARWGDGDHPLRPSLKISVASSLSLYPKFQLSSGFSGWFTSERHSGSRSIPAPEISVWTKHNAIRWESHAEKKEISHSKKRDKRCFHPPFPLAGNICANNSRPWPTFSTSQCFLLSKDALSRWFRTCGIKDGRPSNVIFQGWRL